LTDALHTLPLHDALPILRAAAAVSRCSAFGRTATATLSGASPAPVGTRTTTRSTERCGTTHTRTLPSSLGSRSSGWYPLVGGGGDRKSTRLNSSHVKISY